VIGILGVEVVGDAGEAVYADIFDRVAIGADDREPQRHLRLCFAAEMASEMIHAGFRDVEEIQEHEILVAWVPWQSIIQGRK